MQFFLSLLLSAFMLISASVGCALRSSKTAQSRSTNNSAANASGQRSTSPTKTLARLHGASAPTRTQRKSTGAASTGTLCLASTVQAQCKPSSALIEEDENVIFEQSYNRSWKVQYAYDYLPELGDKCANLTQPAVTEVRNRTKEAKPSSAGIFWQNATDAA
ncbi:hypothetical protein EK21DRAFT_89915 [Setomelanomma holmii]|uniref:Uncharacterized protein n=1 Tax=Setomelanomma holmii TaxID=210430 RepID=A0A9P4H6Y4_9PLEO|nr:hypothetical protein EK21DRAFT_89915 [Setomelanomma holmii]